MDCKYVRQSSCLCFCFHPLSSSIFYLTNTKNRLRIIQQNLYTGLVVNQFAVPLRQQNLNVDNYIINYSPESKHVVLTLSNHVLIYSLEQKILVFVGEAIQSKNPCFIEKAVLKGQMLYFSATEFHYLFAINVFQCLKMGSIVNYTKFKLPPEITALNITVDNNKLVAICKDSNLRVWDIESGNALKGAPIERSGEPTCLSFSKDGEYLLIGTSIGVVQVWDGATLGVTNTLVFNKPLCKQKIQSLAWFHYSGEAQSRRFLMMTRDGNVKLYSFYFQRAKQSKQRWMGKTNQLSLLYSNKGKVYQNFQIRSHEFANFIYFHPGALLYMVDNYPKIYYPVITPQLVHSFESLIPTKNKEIYWQSNFFFVDGLFIKKLGSQIETKVALGSVLEYEGLKILRMDYRPKFLTLNQLPMPIEKGVPTQRLRYKFLINYYLGNMIRSLVLSNISLSGTNDNIQNFKEYSGHTVLFIGPPSNIDPLILILQQDKQTMTVLSQAAVTDVSKYLDEQQPYLTKVGQIYSKQLKIKIQKIFETPFRYSYVVLYLSENLVRFSNNIYKESALIDYDVNLNIGLRLDYNDIVIDIVWTSKGEFGCVICLQKIIFISDELKVMRSVNIQGYVIQGQFIGYTLIVTTKVDVQYVDVSSKPLQLYCIENYQSRYLILGILADRIIGVERFNGVINCKVRYFNLMQPLLSGYISYYSLMNAEIQGSNLKAIIQGFAPYHIVSEQFLALMNKYRLSNFSQYFIESNIKLYSRSIRAATLNAQAKIERFISSKTWLQHKSKILDYLLYYQDLKDSTDNYEIEKSKQYENKLIKLITAEGLHSVKQALAEQRQKISGRTMIATNFGEQSLIQVYYEYSDKQNIFVKMELLQFRATDEREWIGINSIFLQSKIGDNDNDVDVNAVQEEKEMQQHHDQPSDQQDGSQFKDLIVYYRFDDGKGDFIDDLSDYNNEAYLITQTLSWRLLEGDPMEIEDKWGKSCPPQFAVGGLTRREKRLGGKLFKNFSVQLWFRSEETTFRLIKIGEMFQIGLKQGQIYFKNPQLTQVKPIDEEAQFLPGVWTNISFVFNKKQTEWMVFLNAILYNKGKGDIKLGRDLLQIGSEEMKGQYTQFRLWRSCLTIKYIKEYIRSPLQIVAEKRKKLKMKIKQKKKQKDPQAQFFPAFPF